MSADRADDWLAGAVEAMIELQAGLTARPAIGPQNGGQGEWDKARFLEDYLRGRGIGRIEHFDCPDGRVPEGTRPNFVATVPGHTDSPCVWVLCHLDVVPPGEQNPDGSWRGWDADPFSLQRAGGMIVGRGVVDNQQAIVSSVFAAMALAENGIEPPHTLKFVFVSDEECGSELGLGYLLREHGDLFSAKDAIIVPDGGNEDGSMIEVAEKSVLWLEFLVKGRQAHGSRPDKAINAFRAASRLVYLLDKGLNQRFDRVNHVYVPPYSTFEPTMHAANVPNVNTIPGEDFFCFDCRILPEYSLDEVLDYVRAECRHLDGRMGTETVLTLRGRMDAPPPTPPSAPVVGLLRPAIQSVLGVRPQTMGIGGQTVASIFRRHGLPAAVWMTCSGTEHQANEALPIQHMVNDARVFARVFQSEF